MDVLAIRGAKVSAALVSGNAIAMAFPLAVMRCRRDRGIYVFPDACAGLLAALELGKILAQCLVLEGIVLHPENRDSQNDHNDQREGAENGHLSDG
jgi:hypothetical protein